MPRHTNPVTENGEPDLDKIRRLALKAMAERDRYHSDDDAREAKKDAARERYRAAHPNHKPHTRPRVSAHVAGTIAGTVATGAAAALVAAPFVAAAAYLYG